MSTKFHFCKINIDEHFYTWISDEVNMYSGVDDVDMGYIVSCNALDNECRTQNCSDVFTIDELNILTH